MKTTDAPSLSAPRRHLKAKSLDKKKARMGYVFVAPFILGFFVIYLPMIIDSIRISFSDIKINPMVYIPAGFKYYNYALFEDTEFIRILTTNLKSLLLDAPAIVIFSLFMAIILNQKMRGRAIFRAIFFIPVIVSTGIIEYIDINNILGAAMDSSGTVASGGGVETAAVGTEIIDMIDVQKFFESMQIGQGLVKYVTDLVNNVYQIINRSGVQMLIFLAGLQSISPAIYESSYMEGVTAWETFWKITFPMISPMILVNAIYTIIDSFTTERNAVMTYIAWVNDNGALTGMSQAMAMSWIYFLIILLIIGAIAGIISAYVFYQRRD